MKDKAIPKSTHASSGTSNAAAESAYRDVFKLTMPESSASKNNSIEQGSSSRSDRKKNKNHRDSVKAGRASAMRLPETSSLVSIVPRNGMKLSSKMLEDDVSRLNEKANPIVVDSSDKNNKNKATAASEAPQTRAAAEEAGEQQPEAKKKRRKKAPGHPKRPLSAYNFFFKDERNRILNSISSSSDYYEKDQNRGRVGLVHGKIGFEDLAKLIGTRWKETGPEERAPYEKLASDELHRYAIEMNAYDEIQNGYQSFVVQNPVPVPVPVNHVAMNTAFLPFGANSTTIRGPPTMNNGHDFDPVDDMMYQSYNLQYLLPMQGYPNMQVVSEGLYGGGRDQQSIQQHFFSPPSHQLFMMPSQIQPIMQIPSLMQHNMVEGSRNFMNVPIGIVNYQNDTNIPLSTSTSTTNSTPSQALRSPGAQLRQPFRGTNTMTNSAVSNPWITRMQQLQENYHHYQTKRMEDEQHDSNLNQRN